MAVTEIIPPDRQSKRNFAYSVSSKSVLNYKQIQLSATASMYWFSSINAYHAAWEAEMLSTFSRLKGVGMLFYFLSSPTNNTQQRIDLYTTVHKNSPSRKYSVVWYATNLDSLGNDGKVIGSIFTHRQQNVITNLLLHLIVRLSNWFLNMSI